MAQRTSKVRSVEGTAFPTTRLARCRAVGQKGRGPPVGGEAWSRDRLLLYQKLVLPGRKFAGIPRQPEGLGVDDCHGCRLHGFPLEGAGDSGHTALSREGERKADPR